MATLEELVPELAGVLAAQESAMENVVATLTTQVRDLLLANARQAQRVQQLERSNATLESSLVEVQASALAAKQETAELAEAQRRVESQLVAVQAESRSALEQSSAAAETISGDVAKRLQSYVDERIEQASARMSPVQVTGAPVEEAVQTQLELLDKKFDYLSRVKMEIKELTRKVDNQEQVIDGIKIGIEMLSKSIGADEGNSDSDDDDDDDDDDDNASESGMSDVQLPVNENFAPQPTRVPMELSLSLDRIGQPPEQIEAKPSSPDPPTENVRAMAVPQAQIRRLAQRRSLTLDVRNALEIKESRRKTLSARAKISGLPAGEDRQQIHPIIETPRHNETTPEPSISEKEGEETDELHVDSAKISEPSEKEDGTQQDSLVEASTRETSASATDENSSAEVVIEEQPTAEPVVDKDMQEVETTPEPPEQSVEVPLDPIPIFVEEIAVTSLQKEKETERRPSQSTSRSTVTIEEEEPGDGDTLVVEPEGIPPKYKQRTLSHQKQVEENVALFNPSVSSSSASSTSRSSHPSSSRFSLVPSASAVFRSRRQERNARRQTTLIRKESESHAEKIEATARTPLSFNEKREAWRRIFSKLIQLRRLHMLNGISPEKSLFRKQNISVGARVRRLEETSVDLEKAIELLESNIHLNAQGIQTLDELLSQYRLTTSSSVQTLAQEQKAQSKTLLEIDEKLEIFDQEVRKMRTNNRRSSIQSSATSNAAFAAVSVQVQQLSVHVGEQTTALQAAEKLIKQIAENDLPAVGEKADQALYGFRIEIERRLKDWAVDSRRSIESLSATLTETNRSLTLKMDNSFHRLYDDVLQITSAVLQSAEHEPNHGSNGMRHSPLSIGFVMLQDSLTKLSARCHSITESNEDHEAAAITQQVVNFLHEVRQLQEQSTKSQPLSMPTTLVDGNNNNGSPDAPASLSAASSKGFEEHLIQITKAQLQSLEHILLHQENADSERESEDPTEADLTLSLRDAVVQIRAVLFFLHHCRHKSDELGDIQELQAAQSAMAQDITSHSFAINQVGSTLAMVKLMNTRLDSFMELSFTFAKDDDVKKSIQDMISSSSSMRDKLAKQVEDTQRETAQRDAILERDLNQLISRVNKKLDKDELLWTQEVLERQLQSVAKASLGEEDLVDIHRLLRHKLDKTQFNELLQDQRAKMMAGGGGELMSWLGGGQDGNAGRGGPLIGAKCISCQGELPPTKAMIKTVVKQEVQHEIAKAKTQHQVAATVPPTPGFNASNHRNMEKFKTEILLNALQKQGKK